MTRQSTALVFIGPHHVGPWSDRAWRVGPSAQLVEGGLAHWLRSPKHPEESDTMPQGVNLTWANNESTTTSLLVAVAMQANIQPVFDILKDQFGIDVQSADSSIDLLVLEEAPLIEALAPELRERVRLGVVLLHESSLVTPEVIRILTDAGIDVDVFGPMS